MVESGGLENRYTGNGIEGSNPSLSAGYSFEIRSARMAKLADALHSGCSVLTDMQVQVLFRAQMWFCHHFEKTLLGVFFRFRQGPRHLGFRPSKHRPFLLRLLVVGRQFNH